MFSGDAIDEPADPGGRLTLSASPRWRARLQRRGQVGRGDSGTSGIGIGAASVGSGGADDLPPDRGGAHDQDEQADGRCDQPVQASNREA